MDIRFKIWYMCFKIKEYLGFLFLIVGGILVKVAYTILKDSPYLINNHDKIIVKMTTSFEKEESKKVENEENYENMWEYN